MSLLKRSQRAMVCLSLLWASTLYTPLNAATHKSVADTLLVTHGYLEVPTTIRKAMAESYHKGLFQKIEYGCLQRKINKDSWYFFLYVWLILAWGYGYVIIHSLEGGANNIIDSDARMTYHIVIGFWTLLAILAWATGEAIPRYYFITDTGLLIFEEGGPQIFIKYESLVYANMIDHPSQIASKPSFLRIIGQEGSFWDITPEQFISLTAFKNLTERLQKKVAHANHKKAKKKTG